jgi:hypothetical protein
VPPPNDQKLYCPPPQSLANSYKVRNNLIKIGPGEYDGEFEVACYSSFSLQGNAVVKCENGKWSEYPSCVKAASCSLDILNEPALNVNILTSRLVYNNEGNGLVVGSFVQYECLESYSPELSVEDLRVTCLPSGEWSTRLPVKCV